MSLEQIISEQTLATRDLTAAVSQLAEVIKLAGLTEATALPGIEMPANFKSVVVPVGAPTEQVSAQIPATTPTPVFNATEVAADPLAQPAPTPASPAPVTATAAAAQTAAPAPSVAQPSASGTPVTQDQFLAALKAFANGVLPNNTPCERAPNGFLRGLLGELGIEKFSDVPQAKFAEILLKVPVAIRHSIVVGG